MGILSSALGNASELDSKKLAAEFAPILSDHEVIEAAFHVFRDKWVFTNKRLIIVDVQGLTGKKREYHSIPYKSISHFLVETAGHFDLDCEISLWITGRMEPFKYEMRKGVNVVGVQKILAQFICK